MKKRIISIVVTAAMLFSASASVISADTASLSPRATVVVDGGYVKGFEGIPTADYVKSQFAGDVTVADPKGEILEGTAAVPSESTVKSGDAEIAKLLVPGDASSDGKINLLDASAILKYIAKWDVVISIASADADGNGKVTLSDASTVLKYIAKWDIKLGRTVGIEIIKDKSPAYALLANDENTDAAFASAVNEKFGVTLEAVQNEDDCENYITVGTSELCDKYDFIDKEAVNSTDDKAYIDTYNGNVYIVLKSADDAEYAVDTLAYDFYSDGTLSLPRGYFGPVGLMSERGRLYAEAVQNILKTDPVTDGTNGMNEDIYVAISNAAYTEPKNIIYMIGDGMGKNITIGAKYCHMNELYGGKLAMNYLPVEGRQSTYSTNDQITDSAAGGTALSTGYKTTNGTIAMNADHSESYKTLLELAAEKGKSTGIIATKSVTDATPAVFTAHVEERSQQVEIAGQQMAKLIDGTLDLILGGGYLYYNDSANSAVRAAAKEQGVTYTNSWDEAVSSSLPLAGIFTETSMATDGNGDEPHIAAMTDLALDLLSEDEDGFFIMIEGSRIDSYAHSNDFGAEADETFEFDCAVAVAMRYVALHPDTVLVITADHETGGLAVSGEPTVENIRSTVRYNSSGHYWVDVPVYAVGYGTEALEGNHENTDVAIFLAGLMGEENFGQTSKPCTLVDVADKDTFDAIVKYNDNSEHITATDDGILLDLSDDTIRTVLIPASEFELADEDKGYVTAIRVTYTNLDNTYKRLPTCGVYDEEGNLASAYERFTYIQPGETITYTYVMDAVWRHTKSMNNAKEFMIFAQRGYHAKLLISDITAVVRPLDK